MTDTATLTPPEDIMPAEAGNGSSGLVPSAAVIERLRAMANDVASARAGIGGCNSPGALFYKMMLGWEHGIRPMTALSCIDIIEGKGCLNAQALSATIEARGLGKIEIESVDDSGCTVRVTRPDWPADRVERVSYTVQDAFAARFLTPDERGQILRDRQGLVVANKKNWRTNHRDMFVARARSRAHRRWFDVASLGLPYSREELEDIADDAGRPIGVQLDNTAAPWQQPAPSTPPTPPAPADPPPVSPQPDARAVTSSALVETAAPPAGGADAQQIDRARSLVKALRLDANQWAALLARYQPGATSLRQLPPALAGAVLCRLENLHTIRTLRQWGGIAGLTPEQWERALAKRGVTSDLDLSDKDLLEIRDKLWDKVTPFDRQKLGLEPAPAQAQGNVSASSPPSPPWPTTPLSEAA